LLAKGTKLTFALDKQPLSSAQNGLNVVIQVDHKTSL